jgi:hypothetical protein
VRGLGLAAFQHQSLIQRKIRLPCGRIARRDEVEYENDYDSHDHG